MIHQNMSDLPQSSCLATWIHLNNSRTQSSFGPVMGLFASTMQNKGSPTGELES